jgi:hypothetical protein
MEECQKEDPVLRCPLGSLYLHIYSFIHQIFLV